MSQDRADARRLEPLLARVGLLALALTALAALLALDVATAPSALKNPVAAETWSLRLVTHDGRELGGHPDGMELTLSPLLHFENRLASGEGNGYRINAWGLRGPELSPRDRTAATPSATNGETNGAAEPGARPVVAVVGGSAVFGMFVPEEMTFCRLLADRFPDLEVVNGGVIGYLSGQESALVALRLLDLEPALVIACDGWNDCYDGTLWRQATGREHAVPGVNSSFQIMENRLVEYRRLETEPRFALAAWTKLCLRRSRALGWLAPSAKPPPMPEDYPQELLMRAIDAYVENVARMQRRVAGQGGRFVAALQGEAGQLPGPRPDHPLARRLSSEQYTTFRQRAAERLRAQGVEVTDLSQRLAARHESQAVFLDLVHLTPSGHKHVANLLEPYLEDVLREAR